MDTDILSKAADQARGLAMDAVHKCNSGHLGLPLGCADIGAVLWGEALSYNPDAPKWINRDRFVLSAGHGSMFIYSWLHLSGHPVTREQLRNFRQLHSGTPGHPESFETAGVECTTGPLGQGVSNSVGFAMSQRMAAARYNTSEHTIFDGHVVCLFGDGCMQEGISSESSSFAAHNQLDNLILIYDSNDVTLDAMAERTQSEDTAARYRAYGFDVVTVDGHDMDAFLKAFENAKNNDNGQPKLIVARTLIGKGIDEVAGKAAAHGEGGAKFVDDARAKLGLPADEHFYVSTEVETFFSNHKAALINKYNAWEKTFEDWKSANPNLAGELAAGISRSVPTDLLDRIPEFPADANLATRAAGGEVIQSVAEAVPAFFSGSADLYGSTKNYIKASGDWGAGVKGGLGSYGERNVWFGIREHAMCGILNGVAYDGIFRPSGATFFVFTDYCRPSIRLAALSSLPVTYIFTHDSVGVGEDGPTHQPVETLASVRIIPNLDVIRPCDPEETAGAFAAAMERTEGPTMLTLTRQNVPMQNGVSAKQRREGVFKGAYILVAESAPLTHILMGTGSEIQHAVAAAAELGDGVRVVSMPCLERFERQSDAYKESILPASCKKRVSIEAGVTGLWHKYVGTDGIPLGIDSFGLSAPGDTVMKELGMTADRVVAAARSLG
ncbi:transketolase [soil metagenome]